MKKHVTTDELLKLNRQMEDAIEANAKRSALACAIGAVSLDIAEGRLQVRFFKDRYGYKLIRTRKKVKP